MDGRMDGWMIEMDECITVYFCILSSFDNDLSIF